MKGEWGKWKGKKGLELAKRIVMEHYERTGKVLSIKKALPGFYDRLNRKKEYEKFGIKTCYDFIEKYCGLKVSRELPGAWEGEKGLELAKKKIEEYVNEKGTIPTTEEFKKFAVRGNVMDMAVGIVIGGAFGKIISSLVKDVILPPIGLLLGNVDFTQLVITLREKTAAADAVTINYGVFLSTILDFIIIAFAIFMIIRQMNRLKKEEEAAPAAPTTKECPYCFSVIPIKATRCPNCTSELQS